MALLLPRQLSMFLLIRFPYTRYFLNFSASPDDAQFSWTCVFNLRPAPAAPSPPTEILLAYAAPLPPPGQGGGSFCPSCPVGYRMNLMKSGLQKCIRRQQAAAARACCDALAKQDLGQVTDFACDVSTITRACSSALMLIVAVAAPSAHYNA